MRRVDSLVRGLVAVVAFAAPAVGQLPVRPNIAREADPNDWQAYYNAGVEHLVHDGRQADADFAWASHLRPDRAEPLFGRYIAYWVQHVSEFFDYANADERTVRKPLVMRADSLREAALRRSPFVHQGLMMLIFDRMEGRWRDDRVGQAWFALGQANLPVAAERFGRIIQQEPAKYGSFRFLRASIFVNSRSYDSAAAELTTLLAQLRAHDATTIDSEYESKELLEYAMGLLHLQLRRLGPAREAFGRAVAENAAFSAAHAMLGDLAISTHDTATALAEFTLAVETAPSDVEPHIGLGRALLLAGRPSDAATEFMKATSMEPVYAEPYWLLATALEAGGNTANAAIRYGQFLERATLSDPRRSEAERKRVSREKVP